jgi:AcrR family transcriptional regulator
MRHSTESMSLETRKTRKERRQDRRDALKRAAVEVFSEKGFNAAKISQIVDIVGVAQGTFYLYYESKQQLFGELLTDFVTAVVETVANWEPAELANREVLKEELTRVGMMLTEVLQANRDLAKIFFTEALNVAPEFDQMIHEFYGTLTLMLTEFNRILHGRGLIEPMNFRVLATATIGMVERVVNEYIVKGTLRDVPPNELVEHLVAHYLTGTAVSVECSPRVEEG